MKAHLPENEASRIYWLHECRILDTPPEAIFDEVTQFAAKMCGVPIAAISLVDRDRQWFKSIVGLDARQTSRDVAFCAHTILQPDVLVVPDALNDARFADNPDVLGHPNIRFYAGAPLHTSDGYALGSLCVIDKKPNTLSLEQVAALKLLARQVSSRIEMQRHIALQEQLMAERVRIETSLRQSEEELRAIVEQAMDGICLFDRRTYRLLKTNAALRDLIGYSADEAAGLTLYDIVADEPESIDRDVSAVIRYRRGMSLGERRYRRKDGSTLTVEVSARIVHHDAGEAICAVIHDDNARRQAEAARQAAEDSYRSLFEKASEGIFQTTAEGRFRQANPALARMYGYATPHEMMSAITDSANQLHVEPDGRGELVRQLQSSGRVSGFEAQVRRKDGTVIWVSISARSVLDAGGALRWYEGFVEDISARKDLEARRERELCEAQERADRDPLTDLLNHRAFHKRLAEEIDRAARHHATFAVVMMDLDNFKFFNDAYGHVLGDGVLRQVADRLRAISRSYDCLARFGGDEFALLLCNVENVTAAELEERLRADLATLTYRPPGQTTAIPITVSLGAALCSGKDLERTELVDLADERLRRVKTGRDGETGTDQVRAAMRRSLDGFSMLDALVTAVDNKDRYTRRHSEDVAKYSRMIAVELNMDPADQETITVAALLHDVGKIGVPDNILRKPDQLTHEEFEAIKHHPRMGALMVSTVAGLEATVNAVRHHHERWDGKGYPDGLREEECPRIARLMAVADAYSAMTTDRPYRRSLGHERAISVLRAGEGTQWDPVMVQALLSALETHQAVR